MTNLSPSSSKQTLNKKQAATALLCRKQARQSLIKFTEYTHPQYVTAPHHEIIARRLEKVALGDIDRLMINMPPRHGKSELASRRFPAWLLGLKPDWDIILASYNSDLAADFGLDIRSIVQDPHYQKLFETRIRQDKQAASRFLTTHGGGFVAAGIGTAITGRGAHVLIIDDPVKDREEAESEARRQKIWDWYTSTAYTRLAPGGRIIVIQTRWHEDDLSGRLLDHGTADDWSVLTLPAMDKNGEALWPSHYGPERLARIREEIGKRDWAALYQQTPAPEEGAFFKRDHLRWYDRPPPLETLKLYGASDYAVTADGGDWTVHVIAGVDPDDNIYVLDLWRGRTETDHWIEVFLGLVDRYAPLMWAEEQGQILKSLGPFINKRMAERGSYCWRRQYASASDKPTRARAIQARMSMGKVLLPKTADWIDGFIHELLTFPDGKHDDQIDAFSLIGRMLNTLAKGNPPAKTAKPLGTNYADLTFEELMELEERRKRREDFLS